MILEQIQNLLIGRPKSDRRLRRFEKQVNFETKNIHDEIIDWADRQIFKEADISDFLHSNNPIVLESFELRKKLIAGFKDKYKSSRLRILIHYPGNDLQITDSFFAEPSSLSQKLGDTLNVAGNSLFSNLCEGLNFLGVEAKLLSWRNNFEESLNEFKPNVFISCDDDNHFKHIEWASIREYKKKYELIVGLTACTDNVSETYIKEKLNFAKENGIDFYYSFWDEEGVKQSKNYETYIGNGHKIFSLEFGANVLKYFPVPIEQKDLDFIFLASSNRVKRPIYHKNLTKIFRKYKGFYYGPGWIIYNYSKGTNFERDKFFYSRGKVGLNLHVDAQLNILSEVNERTYQLAACGIPQLIDNPKVLLKKFNKDSLFIANSPHEYNQLFEYILNNPQEAQKRALSSLQEVYEKHTSFHRAEKLIKDLSTL